MDQSLIVLCISSVEAGEEVVDAIGFRLNLTMKRRMSLREDWAMLAKDCVDYY